MDTIDFHTHTFPDDLAPRAIAALLAHSPESENITDGTIGELRKSMVKNGITRSVTLAIATKTSQVEIINRACIAAMSDDIIPFGTMHPLYEDFPREIDFLKNSGIKGIKFHPEYQDFYIDDPRFFPMYDKLSQSGLVVVFHAGKDPGPFTCDHALPGAIKKILSEFPSLKIVAAHMGGWKIWDDVEKVLCGLPVYFDTSAVFDYMSREQFIHLMNLHGADRLLFGTDCPWFDQGESRKWIESLAISSGDKEAILGGNAQRLLGL